MSEMISKRSISAMKGAITKKQRLAANAEKRPQTRQIISAIRKYGGLLDLQAIIATAIDVYQDIYGTGKWPK